MKEIAAAVESLDLHQIALMAVLAAWPLHVDPRWRAWARGFVATQGRGDPFERYPLLFTTPDDITLSDPINTMLVNFIIRRYCPGFLASDLAPAIDAVLSGEVDRYCDNLEGWHE